MPVARSRTQCWGCPGRVAARARGRASRARRKACEPLCWRATRSCTSWRSVRTAESAFGGLSSSITLANRSSRWFSDPARRAGGPPGFRPPSRSVSALWAVCNSEALVTGRASVATASRRRAVSSRVPVRSRQWASKWSRASSRASGGSGVAAGATGSGQPTRDSRRSRYCSAVPTSAKALQVHPSQVPGPASIRSRFGVPGPSCGLTCQQCVQTGLIAAIAPARTNPRQQFSTAQNEWSDFLGTREVAGLCFGRLCQRGQEGRHEDGVAHLCEPVHSQRQPVLRLRRGAAVDAADGPVEQLPLGQPAQQRFRVQSELSGLTGDPLPDRPVVRTAATAVVISPSSSRLASSSRSLSSTVAKATVTLRPAPPGYIPRRSPAVESQGGWWIGAALSTPDRSWNAAFSSAGTAR
jgi:hypothetical protein